MEWLSIIADYFNNNEIKLLLGPVSFYDTRGVFKSAQTLEFLGLVASASGFIKLGYPLLGNAANMSFPKEAFLIAEKYRTDYDHPSGDDIFLIQAIVKAFGNRSVNFLKNNDAIVYTNPMTSLRSFFSQRMRWVSKSKKHQNAVFSFVAWITFLFNSTILFSIVLSIIYPEIAFTALLLIIIKTLTELPLMFGITRFTSKLSLLWLILPLEIINVFYVVFIAFAGYFGKAKWKGKTVY
jgi:cellulose synthase/poly-beta-1,6-N-acetylglucosamine synthase-like glycosyltransferase